MAGGESSKGLYDHLYRRFFENRESHQGYEFQHAPGGSTQPPVVAFRDRLRWWTWDRWQRLKTISAARDRFQQDILDLKKQSPK